MDRDTANLYVCKIVRNIMKLYGKNMVYTNKYPTSRSVKCYGQRTNFNDTAMVQSVLATMTELGLRAEVDVRYTRPARKWGTPGLIVNIKR